MAMSFVGWVWPIVAGVLGAATVVSAMIVAATALATREGRDGRHAARRDRNRMLMMVAVAAMAVILLVCTMAFVVFGDSVDRGMDADTMPSSAGEAVRINEVTPVSQAGHVTAESLPGSVMYLYKYGCPDCEGVYDAMMADLGHAGVTVWDVPSSSGLGEMLCERYHVTDVPALVAIGPAGSGLAVSPKAPEGGYDADAVALAVRHALGYPEGGE